MDERIDGNETTNFTKKGEGITGFLENWEERYPHLTQFWKYWIGFLVFVIGLPFAVSYLESQSFPVSKYIHLWYLTTFVTIAILIEFLTEEIGKTNNSLLEDLGYAILLSAVLSPYFYWTNSEFFLLILSKIAKNAWQAVIILKAGYVIISVIIALLFLWQIFKCLHQVGKKNVFNVFYELALLIKDIIILVLKLIKKWIWALLYPFILAFKKDEENNQDNGWKIDGMSVEDEKRQEEMNRQNLINQMIEQENNPTSDIFWYTPTTEQPISATSEEINPFLTWGNWTLPTDTVENNLWINPNSMDNGMMNTTSTEDPLNTYFWPQEIQPQTNGLFQEQKPEELNPMLDANNDDIFGSLFGDENVNENFNNGEDLLSTLDEATLNSDDFIDNPIENEINQDWNQMINPTMEQQTAIEEEKVDIFNDFFTKDEKFYYFSNGYFTIDESIENLDKEKLLIFLTNK